MKEDEEREGKMMTRDKNNGKNEGRVVEKKRYDKREKGEIMM